MTAYLARPTSVGGGGVGHDDVGGPVDDVKQDEGEWKDAPGDGVDASSLSFTDIRVHRTRLTTSPHVLQTTDDTIVSK